MSDRAKDEEVHGPEPIGAGVASPLNDYHEAPDVASPSRKAGGVASRFFGSALEPVLVRECAGRLSRISWFRADWQRGGALTGYATYAGEDGGHPVVVKMPVPPGERRWLVDLQDASNVVPRLYAHGEQLNGYDIAWVVMERMPHGPLGPQWSGREFDLVVEAAGRFYAAAARVPIRGKPIERDWEQLFVKARDHVHVHSVPDEQRWKEALKKAHRRLREWIAVWNDRPTDDWCHGDLHLGNALSRHPPAPPDGGTSDTPEGPAVLIDFAHTHRGCWVEDAVYFEHLFWSHRRRLGGRKLCKALAKARRDHGLPVEPNWADFAAALRALYALTTPARLYDDGDPLHLSAALKVLEAVVR